MKLTVKNSLFQWFVGIFFVGSYIICQVILDEDGEFAWQTAIPFTIIYYAIIIFIAKIENRREE